VKESDINRMY